MNVLITGGTGYIGSHICLQLLEAGHDVIAIDNFANSSAVALERVKALCGRSMDIVTGDIRDDAILRLLFQRHQIDAVIHMAGLKAVGESSAYPLEYYDNNVAGSITLFRVMQEAGVKRLIFSSSATVYGKPKFLPLTEEHPLEPTNTYGRTKLAVEKILGDLCHADPEWRVIMLRYFNPIGAHPSGAIGEDPRGIPNNLLPFVAQVATGRRERLTIYGEDYDTPDGTGIRDYVHVLDVADSHVAALEHLSKVDLLTAVNVGTGRGYTVREVVAAFERACGRPIRCVVAARRRGDVDACYADTGLAARILEWTAKRDLDMMCADVWRWQQQNPDGYEVQKSPQLEVASTDHDTSPGGRPPHA